MDTRNAVLKTPQKTFQIKAEFFLLNVWKRFKNLKDSQTGFLSQIVPMDKKISVSTDLPNCFLVEDQNCFAQGPKMRENGDVECSFDNTAKNFFIETDSFLSFFRKRWEKFFQKKNIFPWKIFFLDTLSAVETLQKSFGEKAENVSLNVRKCSGKNHQSYFRPKNSSGHVDFKDHWKNICRRVEKNFHSLSQ